jgi:hypothetical protein
MTGNWQNMGPFSFALPAKTAGGNGGGGGGGSSGGTANSAAGDDKWPLSGPEMMHRVATRLPTNIEKVVIDNAHFLPLWGHVAYGENTTGRTAYMPVAVRPEMVKVVVGREWFEFAHSGTGRYNGADMGALEEVKLTSMST